MTRNLASMAPAINREELIERMMGSAALADRMLNRFLETAAADCDLIESTVRLGDVQAIVSVAHRHRGTAQTLAAPRVAQVAGELESRAHTDSVSQLLDMVDQLRTLHQEIRQAVANGFDDSKAQKGSVH